MTQDMDKVISDLKISALQRCKDRIESACKEANKNYPKEEYGITSKRKKDFLF